MGGQIVAAFVKVAVIRLVFGHSVVEETLKVLAHFWSRIFIDGQGSRSLIR
jgi:hypothetical protein